MKNRLGFVTNSSSSSFIIRNKTDRTMTSKQVAQELVDKILGRYAEVIKDAEGRFEIAPHDEIIIECGDHSGDGAFECFIHNEVEWDDETENVSVEFYESHH